MMPGSHYASSHEICSHCNDFKKLTFNKSQVQSMKKKGLRTRADTNVFCLQDRVKPGKVFQSESVHQLQHRHGGHGLLVYIMVEE